MKSSVSQKLFSLLAVLCLALVVACPVRADIDQAQEPMVIILGEHQYQAEIDWKTGDTLAVIQLHDIYCFNRKHFRSKRHELSYWKMVNDVKKTLPIAKAARRLMNQSYIEMQGMTEQEQKAHFKKLEKELSAQYKPRLKKLTYRQGKLLVRLVDRECQMQTYAVVREFFGKRRAFFWNMFGNLFGVSLKARWDPDGKDKELEDVCIQVEQGLI